MAKFADMTEGERLAWMLWAKAHDWGESARWEGHRLGNLLCERDMRTGEYKRVSFDNPADMRAWKKSGRVGV